MPDYAQGHIYGIADARTGECIYVGASCNLLCCRWGNHRNIVVHGRAAHNGSAGLLHAYMKAEGLWHFGIFEIEAYPCAGRVQLRERERQVVMERHPRFFNAYSMVVSKRPSGSRASVKCECGAVVSKAGLRSHQRTAKHRLSLALCAPPTSTGPAQSMPPWKRPEGTVAQSERTGSCTSERTPGPSGPD